MSINRGFLSMIDLNGNIQKGIASIRGVSPGAGAVMIIGLTMLSCALAYLTWVFDIDATLSYATPFLSESLPLIPIQHRQFVAFMVLCITMMPTIVELFLPRIAQNVSSAALLLFIFAGIDATTDWPRVVQYMEIVKPEPGPLQWVGLLLWYPLHLVLLLFATFLFELLLVLCVVLIMFLVIQIGTGGERTRKELQG